MSALWFNGHEWETELDGLPGLRNDKWTRALLVFLAVLAFLSLGAVLSLPARADLVDVVIDQVEGVIETATTTIAGDSAAPVEEVVAEVVPPVVEEAVEVVDVVPPDLEEAVELVDVVPPIVDELVAVIEDIPPLVEEAIELEAVIPPIVEIVEEVLPVVEIVEDVLPVVDVIPLVLDDVVESVPPLVMDAAEVLPILVPNAVDSPGPIAIPTVPALVPTLDSPLVSLPADLTKGQPQQSAGLFTKQLVDEIAQFQLAELTENAAGRRSSSSPVSDPETASLAGYVPITRSLPVAERGAGASGPIGSSHSGSGFFGGIDAFGFFAAVAALLALCLVGWIRDRSSSGRSIFPSHGGRPG